MKNFNILARKHQYFLYSFLNYSNSNHRRDLFLYHWGSFLKKAFMGIQIKKVSLDRLMHEKSKKKAQTKSEAIFSRHHLGHPLLLLSASENHRCSFFRPFRIKLVFFRNKC
jgi:hypothetical protein